MPWLYSTAPNEIWSWKINSSTPNAFVVFVRPYILASIVFVLVIVSSLNLCSVFWAEWQNLTGQTPFIILQMRDEHVFSCVIKTKDTLFCLHKCHNIICKVCFCFSVNKMVSIHLWSSDRYICTWFYFWEMLFITDVLLFIVAKYSTNSVELFTINWSKTLILNIICQASQQKEIQARYPPSVYKHVFAFL